MKTWQVIFLSLSLVLAFPLLFWMSCCLWPFSPRLALTFEFSALAAFVFTWFIFLDRAITPV